MIRLALPFEGDWLTQMSPARRVPSHGTDVGGISYGIDFVGVGDDGRSAPRNPGAAFRGDHPSTFVGFGRPILAPVGGRVVVAHDGEEDHEGYRGALPLVSYALGQRRRLATGIHAITGNHVVIDTGGAQVFLLHLRKGSLTVAVGDDVTVGAVIGACGNSGNSTEPHLHLHVSDSLDWTRARGIPLRFEAYRSVRSGQVSRDAVPRERELVRPV